MTAATHTDADILRALDFDAPTPCEHHEHPTKHHGDQPARWFVITLCPHCQHVGKLHLCEPGRRMLEAASVVACRVCRGTAMWATFRVFCEGIGGGV